MSDPVIESSGGDFLAGNQWIKIGLSRESAKMLKELGQRWGIKERPCANTLELLVLLAMQNIETVQDWHHDWADLVSRKVSGEYSWKVQALHKEACECLRAFLADYGPSLDLGDCRSRFN